MIRPALIQIKQLDSSNSHALKNWRDFNDGTTLRAVIQSAGRGRRGRTWLSGEGENLTFTHIIKKPGLTPTDAHALVRAATVALLHLCGEKGIPARIKWPNDLLSAKGEKLAGVLAESVFENGEITCLAIGIGLNVNASAETLAMAGQPASSLHLCCPEKTIYDLDDLMMQEMQLFQLYRNMYFSDPKALEQRWLKGCRLIGTRIECELPDGRILAGSVNRVNSDGTLEVRDQQGLMHNISCGDLRYT